MDRKKYKQCVPTTVLLGIYPKELKCVSTQKPAKRGFKFIMAKIWRQPRCPRAGAWISKLWYLQIMGYYSVLKRN